MELQALLVLCGVGVAGAAVLLLMGLFSASGTSYEEAMAQQRRATTELLALAESKNKPKKNVKKANKKLAKKEKKESITVTSSDHESEAPAESGADEESPPAKAKPHVEFTADISAETSKIRKRGKVKPILINKEDMSCVTDPEKLSPVLRTANHFEKIHPKDEFELMHSSFVAEKAVKEQEKEVKPAKVRPGKQSSASPEAKEETTRDRHNSGDAPKEQRKGKKSEKKPAAEEPMESREEVIPPLNIPQPSELTTEKLLKQALSTAAPPAPAAAPPAPAPAPAPATTNQTPPGKGKKNKKQEPNVLALLAAEAGGVSVSSLVRLVNEAALSRTEIQILTDTLLNKQHDALPVHSEWTEGPNDPMQKMKKQLADKEKALVDEVEASQALHAKLKELRTSLNAERSRAVSAARCGEQATAELRAAQARLHALLEDNHKLAQEKIILQSKSAAEAAAAVRAAEEAAALAAQAGALQAEAAARAHDAAQARCDAARAHQHAADIQHQLQEANRVCAEFDALRQSAAHAEAAAQAELRQARERIEGMAELQNELQRLSSRAQIAESNAEKIKEDAEKQKQQLSSELLSLKEQLAASETEIAELKQLKATAAPAQNGLPPSNLTDQHKAAELAKVEGVIESLRAELAAAAASCAQQRDQLTSLTEQLAHYQQKNNELRTKNWKVMEALQSAEKALQSKLPSALPAQDSLRDSIAKAQEAQYSEVASILKSAFPSASPAGPPGRAWVETFANSLKKELSQAMKPAVTSSPPEDSRVAELGAQNEHLQGLVDKYKTIIDDTEGVLSRLQQNVTAEEQRWARQLADKQQELDDLRLRTVTQMQNKIDSLQLELRQAQASNHSHSFADSERLTEERLLGGLSEKHKLNSSNGPLQVGLEEK